MAEHNKQETDPSTPQRQDEGANPDQSQGKRVGKGESHDSRYGQGHSTGLGDDLDQSQGSGGGQNSGGSEEISQNGDPDQRPEG